MKEKLFTNQKETKRAIKAAVDQANKTKKHPTHCVLCGSIPKSDEWSSQVENCCMDCA
tara:strand:+ start:1046 stop:1219 length:174 start_codon:yes stop_codon:yes gene_type:complete